MTNPDDTQEILFDPKQVAVLCKVANLGQLLTHSAKPTAHRIRVYLLSLAYCFPDHALFDPARKMCCGFQNTLKSAKVVSTESAE